jgi:hypothetical protein
MLQQLMMVGDHMCAEGLFQLPDALLQLLCLGLSTGSRSCENVARELRCIEVLLQERLQGGLGQYCSSCSLLLLGMLLPCSQLLLCC